ncbi:putative periplasmic serine endoprotease DegP-like precursor [Pseudobythopirellula maris]|uniref:Putative periplasmic serine endoprotease DegP-like n=1 Tax=Pseudobythopirellula maris TaxID=2527991 RepID=A0A5C5ZVU6_9BACT|nr:PDZ domain-containing protein [Pseudobythopirellula maris]TWT91137.1 putative periplasmic serine endoprotease DegP-like precursor [Pseudobythopirellula maris]
MPLPRHFSVDRLRCFSPLTAALAAVIASGVLAGGAATAQQAKEEEGTIVQIGPDKGQDDPSQSDARDPRRRSVRPGFGGRFGPPQPALSPSPYYIGLVGGDITPELLAHLDLPKGGLLVREVTPDGPAAEAGVERHDVLVRANGKPLTSMQDLVEVVDEQGKAKGRITLELIRGGRPETVWVDPKERPQNANPGRRVPQAGRDRQFPNQPGMFGDLPPGVDEQMLLDLLDDRWPGLLDREDGPFDDAFGGAFGEGAGPPGFGFRGAPFGQGPNGGRVQAQQFQFRQLPNGVSVSVTQQNNEPAQITVRRGDEEWVVEGDDPESLAALPEDLRPFVEQMLNQQAAPRNFRLDQGDLQPPAARRRAFGDDLPGLEGFDPENEIQQRLDEMERQMQEFRQRMRGEAPGAAEPPVQPEGAEVEIPAE